MGNGLTLRGTDTGPATRHHLLRPAPNLFPRIDGLVSFGPQLISFRKLTVTFLQYGVIKYCICTTHMKDCFYTFGRKSYIHVDIWHREGRHA